MTTTKAASLALYAVLNTFNPDWRTAYPSIQAAAAAAGDAAKLNLKAWSALFEVRRNTPPALPKVNFESRADGRTFENTASDIVFDNSAAGRYNRAELFDEPGRETPVGADLDARYDRNGGYEIQEDDIGEKRGPARGCVEDPLFHPTRPHSDVPYKWVHTPPRSFGAIKCY